VPNVRVNMIKIVVYNICDRVVLTSVVLAPKAGCMIYGTRRGWIIISSVSDSLLPSRAEMLDTGACLMLCDRWRCRCSVKNLFCWNENFLYNIAKTYYSFICARSCIAKPITKSIAPIWATRVSISLWIMTLVFTRGYH
jgi:hypothetical protein